MHRREVRLAFSLFLGLGLAGSVVGCEEEFSDQPFGTLDLAPVYDGSTPSDPAAGIPEEIPASRGYLDGQVAEYYDFGTVPSIINPEDGTPIAVRVQPMYFFFTDQGVPLFSRPVRELRDGTDWIKGGHDVLNPNPKDFCVGATDMEACKARNEEEKKKSYPQRVRDPWTDPDRGNSDDYQRPLIDLTPLDNDPPRREYTGLWEIVEVTTPKGYVPDSIKSFSTLDRGVAAGKYKVRPTGKVINCPLIDERTYVLRGITSRRTFRPRIELWYQRQLAVCFLANGWETLGLSDGTRWFAGQDAERLDTFDVARVTVGSGAGASQELVVPVGRAYEPAVRPDIPAGMLTRPAGNIVTASKPRQAATDPSGYTPMRWMFDVRAPSDFESGGWKSLGDIDPSKATPRPAPFTRPMVKNLPLRGVALPCSFEPNYETVDPRTGRRKMQCGRKIQDHNKPLECNRDTCFCDAPIVGYGQACGPGIAQCSRDSDKFSDAGYVCFPPWGGFCQKACRGANTMAQMNLGKEVIDWVDSRCFGAKGFVCFGQLGCIKLCDQNITDMPGQPPQCAVSTMVGSETRDIQAGQTCQDFGLQVCAWPDTWEPKEFTIPQ
jgi:hypothetical protein